MKKVCLKVGLSYVAKGISCMKGKVVEVGDDVAARLVKTWRFDIVDSEPVVSESAAPAGKSANITSMKKEELIAFAEAQGIDVKDCKTNEERIQRIQSGMDLKAFTQLASEE